jgi:hypothetical protein
VDIYNGLYCSIIIFSSQNEGCFNVTDISPFGTSASTTSSTALIIIFYPNASCTGIPLANAEILPDSCTREIDTNDTQPLSYSVKFSP